MVYWGTIMHKSYNLNLNRSGSSESSLVDFSHHEPLRVFRRLF